MDKNKLVLPISILLGCIILGGFYYLSQVNKQASIERQQQTDLLAKTEQDKIKTEQDKRDYIAKRKTECLAIYKTESDKFNNVKSWSYIEPSTNIFNFNSDTCEIIYKGTDGKNFSNYF